MVSWLCSMTTWQETCTLCSFRLWLSRTRDNLVLDLNTARQDGKQIGGDVATKSLGQLRLPDASSHLGLFDHKWVNGRRTCSFRRAQGSEELWRVLSVLQVSNQFCIHWLPSSVHKCLVNPDTVVALQEQGVCRVVLHVFSHKPNSTLTGTITVEKGLFQFDRNLSLLLCSESSTSLIRMLTPSLHCLKSSLESAALNAAFIFFSYIKAILAVQNKTRKTQAL